MMKKLMQALLMTLIAIGMGVGVVYAYDPGLFSTLHVDETSALEGNVTIGTPSVPADLDVVGDLEVDGNVRILGSDRILSFSETAGVRFTPEGYIFFSDPSVPGGTGAIIYGGNTSPLGSREADFNLTLASLAAITLAGDTGVMTLGTSTGTGQASTLVGVSLGGLPENDDATAIIHAAATGGGTNDAGPYAFMGVVDDPMGMELDTAISVEADRDEQGHPVNGKVKLNNSAGSSLTIESGGDVVIQLGN